MSVARGASNGLQRGGQVVGRLLVVCECVHPAIKSRSAIAEVHTPDMHTVLMAFGKESCTSRVAPPRYANSWAMNPQPTNSRAEEPES